jgi:hypothetical protein
MNDCDLGFANIQRELERNCALHRATVEDNRREVATMDDVSFWIDFGPGKRRPLTITRRELDESRDAVSVSATQKINEAFRA